MVNQTQQCIREAMITLLKEKEYNKIQMKEIASYAHVGRKTLYRYFNSKEAIAIFIAESLMDRFALEIKAQKEMTLQSVSYAFFSFVEKNKDELKLLKRARLLSYIEENLFDLVTKVTVKTKYEGMSLEEVKELQKKVAKVDHYSIHYSLAGYWQIAMVWMDSEDDLSKDQMTEIAVKIMTAQYD